MRPGAAAGRARRRRTAFSPAIPSGPRRGGCALRVLLLLLAVWGIVEFARRWDALHPLRTALGQTPAEPLSGGPYLDWGILERRRALNVYPGRRSVAGLQTVHPVAAMGPLSTVSPGGPQPIGRAAVASGSGPRPGRPA